MDLDEKVKEQMRLIAEIHKLPQTIQAEMYKNVMQQWNGNYKDFCYWDLMIQEYKTNKTKYRKYNGLER